jgi:beta-ureidopropionase / N-carbamoyl-L-amino-acid hydrolase
MRMPRSTSPGAFRIHASNLQRKIDRLADVATTRLAYSEEDIRGRQLVMEMMREVGLAISIDAAGNILGRREGTRSLPAIMFGSHIDTVREAGRFDGVLGVVAAIECVAVLQAADTLTLHPLEVVIFANEEGQNFGALCGSRAAVGDISSEDLRRSDASGRTLSDAIRGVGGKPEELQSSIYADGRFCAFVELHIEQGGELDRLGIPIGAVEGISGIQHTDVLITGVANHSGTTTMEARHDALAAAAELVLLVRKMALEQHSCRVATVGRLAVSPNSVNIVPGSVELTVELRDMQATRIARTMEDLKVRAESIAERYGVSFEFLDGKFMAPVPAHPAVLNAIEQSCLALQLPFQRIPSGAGHDAQMMGRIAPMGMIFVPSVGGISHSSKEFTEAEDCARGAEVLLETILRLDRLPDEAAIGVAHS